MRIRNLNHSTYQHMYHIVWGTKYRRHFLKPDVVQQAFKESLRETEKSHPEICILVVNTDLDHVHIQLEIAPSVSVASVVQAIKANASITLKKKFTFINKMYLDGNIWSVGYFSSTNGMNEEMIRKYIEQQGRRDYPTSVQSSFGFS